MTRRERTRRLIELGGLIAKAHLDVLANDDRAVLYGAFLAIAGRLSGEDRERVLLLWSRRGHDAFEREANAKLEVAQNSTALGGQAMIAE